MTFPQTVIMLAIGTLIIQAVIGKGLWVTFGVEIVLVLSLILVEYIQLKSDAAEFAIAFLVGDY